MKKLLLIFALLFTVATVHAQPACWRTSADIDLNECVTEFDGDIKEPEVYEMKGGYKLILRPVAWVEEEMRIRATQVYIEKDGKLRLLPDSDACSEDLVNKYMFRYDGVDFDDYFIITIYGGEYTHYLYEKSSGKMVLKYANSVSKPIYRENLLIYNDGDGENESVHLLDLKSLKKYTFDPFNYAQKENVLLYGTYWWNSAFQILAADSNKATIEFWGLYKPIFDEKHELIDSEDYSITFDIELK